MYPALASLEMLLYPKAALVIANEVLRVSGMIEVIPPEAPLTLFVWGPADRAGAADQLRDHRGGVRPALNPIRARVELSLNVLTYQDLGLLSVGGALFMAHQIAPRSSLGRRRAPIAGAASGVGISISVGGSIRPMLSTRKPLRGDCTVADADGAGGA